jgi:hypothetical protein
MSGNHTTAFRACLAALAFAAAFVSAGACGGPVSVCPHSAKGSFALIRNYRPAALYVETSADPAVRHAAAGFADDLQRVSGRAPQRLDDVTKAAGDLVIAGVIGQSPAIDALIKDGKIAVADIAGQWEAFRQIVVEHPFPNVPRALVIVGADRRGVVFGLYDLSAKIGVSPWYWFADVPVARKADLFVTAGSHRDSPKVKYRGIFINDEDPSFGTWSRKKFGGSNAKAYAHVFELILRLKGNYLWPAMWTDRAFNVDDPKNMVLADEMGVVMGTSHHEPMMRSQGEWHHGLERGVLGGKWDYTTNGETLRTFWRGGIERMMRKPGGYESVVTVGMRGDGDEPMTEGSAIDLLQKIVADQRQIIADVTGKPADRTAQIWALYKEVQDYYDHGMQVPDDVTLLFADDNWGQIRRIPGADRNRKGGFGMYYHFEYVGATRNYKWLNTNQIEKTWQQMDLAYAGGIRTLWIVNVGDIKPMEYPIDFFLKQAWDPEAMTLTALKAFPKQWATANFGPGNAGAIAALVTRYSQLVARRKPELIDENSFALGAGTGTALDGGEFGRMVGEWTALETSMLKLKAKVPAGGRDAFFELVEHPILAMTNLYRLYYATAWNRRLSAANDPRADAFADQAEAAFRRDQEISDRYHAIAHGKWDGMMLQTHIGYTSWQEPKTQTIPKLTRVAGKAGPIRFASVKPADDAIAIEAPHFTRAFGGKGLAWHVVPHLGRTDGAVIALPQAQAATTEADGVRLEYDVTVKHAGDLNLRLILVPTLDVRNQGGLKVGVSLDGGAMQVLRFNPIPAPTGSKIPEQRLWENVVNSNAVELSASFPGVTAGKHTIKVWRLDDNVVLEKLVAATGPISVSYLGPPPARK